MSVFKRPQLRCKVEANTCSLKPGDSLYDTIYPPIHDLRVQPVRPVYHQERYLQLLEQNYKSYGLPFKDRKLPVLPKYVKPITQEEPDVQFYDRVYLMITILKSGIVRVKLNTGMVDLYEKYFKYNKHPPQKSIIKVYRSLGFSEKLIKKIEASYRKIPSRLVAFQKCIDSVFNRPSASKPKKKKVVVVVVEPDPEELIKDEIVEEEVDEDDDPGEDGEMDVEADADADEEVEEEYVNDD